MKKILIIDDEIQIRKMLKMALEAADFKIETAGNGLEGLQKLARWRPDLVILDLSLPDEDGLQILKRIRQWSKTPVIVLTARNTEEDKVRLLDAGADDYMTKPFGVEELLARIRVALRHIPFATADTPVFSTSHLKIDFTRRIVTVDQREIHLTPIEYNLLTLFAHNPGKVITSHHIMKTIWGPGMEVETGYLRIYILQLRRKIEIDPQNPKLIITEPGIGYRLIVE
jgi:two-component system KDP operon response regulator KdpE